MFNRILRMDLPKKQSAFLWGARQTGKSSYLKQHFENAVYYVNHNEWNYAFEKSLPSYITDDYLMLKDSNQIKFTNRDGIIDKYIHYQLTGAHCPYHQVFKIEENDEIIFFGGDVAPQLQQMKNRFKAKYDYDGAKAMELRRQWWKQGEEENWAFIFYHDIKYPIPYDHDPK